MIGFGCDNHEFGDKCPPFMIRMIDDIDHELIIYIAATQEGEKTSETDYEALSKYSQHSAETNETIKNLLVNSVEIVCDMKEIWEIRFDSYALFMERDESYTTYDHDEIRKGKTLIIFEKSKLLDDISRYGFADIVFPNALVHYGVYCEDHIIDVITNKRPSVRKLSPDEITALRL